MIKVATPPDLNNTTRRHPRTLNEAFLCDAESAQAIFKEVDVLEYGLIWWACIVILAVLAGIVIVAAA
ncbi:MAG TPA: hypothetical protein PLL92_00400 [Alicycliphilus sp.]|nr:hypothetical protein [Alicycliphilus sp.]